MPELVVDTGPVVAMVDADDPDHARCRRLLEDHRGTLVLPVLCVAEIGYLLGHRLGPIAEVRFCADLAAGAFLVDGVAPGDWMRIAELVGQYRDFPLGVADASVLACAERRGATTVATLDRRHFTAIRPRHVDAFELVP